MPGTSRMPSSASSAARVSIMAKASASALAPARNWAVSLARRRGIEKFGPQERSPSGGYFIDAAKARASPTELTIGAITASAPKSSARLAMSKRPTGTRTSPGLSACISASMPRSTLSSWWPPCCMSRVTASKPVRATASTVSASGRPDHAV